MTEQSRKREIYAREADSLQRTSYGASATFWSPEVGENQIRVLPPKDFQTNPDAVFFKKISVHWNVGPAKRKINCRHMLGANEQCPVCDFAAQLKASGRSDEKAQGEDLDVSTRYAMNIIDLKDTASGVQVFEASKTLFQDILAIFLDPDFGDIDSLERGRHLKIKRVGTGKFDTRYSLIPAAAATRIKAEIMEKVLGLDALYPVMAIQQIEDILAGRENTGAAAGDDVSDLVEDSSGVEEEEVPFDEKATPEAESGEGDEGDLPDPADDVSGLVEDLEIPLGESTPPPAATAPATPVPVSGTPKPSAPSTQAAPSRSRSTLPSSSTATLTSTPSSKPSSASKGSTPSSPQPSASSGKVTTRKDQLNNLRKAAGVK